MGVDLERGWEQEDGEEFSAKGVVAFGAFDLAPGEGKTFRYTLSRGESVLPFKSRIQAKGNVLFLVRFDGNPQHTGPDPKHPKDPFCRPVERHLKADPNVPDGGSLWEIEGRTTVQEYSYARVTSGPEYKVPIDAEDETAAMVIRRI